MGGKAVDVTTDFEQATPEQLSVKVSSSAVGTLITAAAVISPKIVDMSEKTPCLFKSFWNNGRSNYSKTISGTIRAAYNDPVAKVIAGSTVCDSSISDDGFCQNEQWKR